MYAYLRGTLVEINPIQVVLEIQGVGYQVLIPHRVASELPQIGEPVCLYTSFVIREFSQQLYGFLSQQERDIFEVLMNVTGVGPKLALSLIGHLSLYDLHLAVKEHHINVLCKVPGVGKKTAERLIIELRDKLPSFRIESQHSETLAKADPRSQTVQDAMMALINLGYQQNAAQKAIKQSLKDLPEEVDLALLITASLKNI